MVPTDFVGKTNQGLLNIAIKIGLTLGSNSLLIIPQFRIWRLDSFSAPHVTARPIRSPTPIRMNREMENRHTLIAAGGSPRTKPTLNPSPLLFKIAQLLRPPLMPSVAAAGGEEYIHDLADL